MKINKKEIKVCLTTISSRKNVKDLAFQLEHVRGGSVIGGTL